MSENESQIQVETQGMIEKPTDGLTDFLAERDNKYKKAQEEKVAKEKKEPAPKQKPKADENKVEKKPKPAKIDTKLVEKSKIEEPEEDDEPEESKSELEIKRLNKMIADSNKWGHSNSRKNKAALKHAQSLLDDNELTEEAFGRLSD